MRFVIHGCAAAVLALAAASCGDDGEAVPVGEAPPGVDVSPPPPPDGDDDGDAGPEEPDGPPDEPPSQASERQEGAWVEGCQELAGSGSGVYGAHEAGEVELRVEGGEFSHVEARPNPGWEVNKDDWDDDEVDVTFERDKRKVEFEAELDDGELQVEVCLKR